MLDAPLQYSVERSNRRTIGLYVERDGSVFVRAPMSTTDERIAAAVKAKEKWIYRTQARWAELNPQQARKEFVSGETVYFLGQPYRLDFKSDGERGLEQHGDTFVMHVEDRDHAEALLKGFYRAEGLVRLPALVKQHAASMGVVPGKVRVQELGHRWGSCSPKGGLNFHWKALAVPVEVLHYLVVHELAHLTHRDHSPLFWRTVEAELSGWKVLDKWLAEHGAEMTL
jgi:predicted metal-dependent hydrolase